MAFFQNSVLQKYLQTLDKTQVELAYQKFQDYFHNSAIQQNIRLAKEEQFQEGFLRELFVNILGYTLNPHENYNLTTELKNEKGAKKADGAILQNGKALAVIELKGTDTKDLDKINNQAFNYKNNQTSCVYVITSNFEKLRFFIHNSVDHLEFNLFTLSQTEFNLLYLCLHADNLLANVPLQIKENSIVAEEKITKQLYKDYASFRTDLWNNLVKNNPDKNQLMLFKKTQKLLDRFLFIFFAEDSGLLPPNSISRIIQRWELLKQEDAYKPLYKIFAQYFGYINTGRKGKTEQDDIFAYNGGLFLDDEILDNVDIDDAILYPHVAKLTQYDFQSEVDVNILGHIFENSLNEIENITAQIEGQELDKSKTKRKKDGVFYTPKYITKYIVDNTVGKLCEEKKAELQIVDEEYAKGRKNRKKELLKTLDENLQAYRNWLLQITICDPACGSGAFLNQALEFLMQEHSYIDELESQFLGSSFTFPGVENHILEKNIFGVDINDESVEIAKLSLWLRTAQRGRKLTTLNNNIKCGNSLIDDPEVAGEKAFNWQQEFPQVFEKGGFDVVIGNPPYVVYIKSIFGSKILNYVNEKYNFSEYNPNTYALFVDLALNSIIKINGYLGFIIPNSWLEGKFFSKMRIGVYSKCVDEIVYLRDKVFQEIVETVILLSKNTKVIKEIIKLSEDILNQRVIFQEFKKSKFLNGFNPFVTNENSFLEKLSNNYVKLSSNAIVYRGLETKENSKWLSEFKINDSYLPILLGRDVNRYNYNFSGTYVNFIKKEMKSNANELMYMQPKILMRRTGVSIIATIDLENMFALKNLYLIVPKNSNEIFSMIAQLNSKLLAYFHKEKSSNENKAFAQFKGEYIENFPYVKSKVNFEFIINKVINDNYNLNALIVNFISHLEVKFEIEKLTTKLQNWHELEFKDFLKELSKAKVKLSLSEEAEWMQYFNEQKQKAQQLKSEINKTDKEIDQMVYELYELTEEEIKIVENS